MNEKFRAIGLDTEDKITEFIDYIDDLEDTEEIKSDVYRLSLIHISEPTRH